MKKVICLISNRASYFRQKSLLLEMKKEFKLTLVACSSVLYKEHRNTLEDIKEHFKTITLKSSYDYNGTQEEMCYQASEIALKSTKILKKINPHAVMVLADRWELLPFATTTAYLNIPLIHVQGGEVSGNIDDKVRNAVSMLADIHFTSHEIARRKLKSMGCTNIFDTGCPSIDLIKKLKIKKRKRKNNYVICIFHPHTKELKEANEQASLVAKHVSTFCKSKGYKLYWFASNNDPGFKDVQAGIKDINIVENLVGEDFLKLLAGAKIVVGNSSAGIRESSFLGITSVNVGDRQQNRVAGPNCINTSFTKLPRALEMADNNESQPCTLFGKGNATDNIIKEINFFLGGK